ncbi:MULTISPECIES: diacylglycerol kinase family protein [unclassified Streptomyces]|uniref:diacylglycerol kinase family protein n=1 Tax=unclassified Streptomyces TaxID=2593676 RepID=UPI0007F38B17|nr:MULTISPECIES: diacylglycerol kinase family protein [unclassified Streptomyces]MCM1976234.1 acylglycerol kinase family protein [Streptomyces sp. G1]SBT93683.1 Diacylglycerol kinase catalytic domain-containing protein [Streptomyces sp. DI166]
MAEVATSATSEQLLVVIDPVARHTDGESVRIAKDVLSAGAATKVCLPEGPEEFARALTRRGSRRPVVVGDDRALVRAVSLLHRRRELAGCALSVVPVGAALTLAGALGLPTGAVAAARAVLDGVEHRVDVLVDDSDGVVLGALRIPALPSTVRPEPAEARPWLRTYQSLFRTLAPARPAPAPTGPAPTRLRVEVDGMTLIDLDQQVENVSVTPDGSGTASVEVRPAADEPPLLARGHRITVSGPDFRYRADALEAGPVRRRTWTVWEGALGLVLPGK